MAHRTKQCAHDPDRARHHARRVWAACVSRSCATNPMTLEAAACGAQTGLQHGAGSPTNARGETFQMLSPDVAYLKLSSIKAAEVAGYIEKARTAKALIVDIRNYPSDFVVYALGNLLVDSRTPFVAFHARRSCRTPAHFRWGADFVPRAAGPTLRRPRRHPRRRDRRSARPNTPPWRCGRVRARSSSACRRRVRTETFR